MMFCTHVKYRKFEQSICYDLTFVEAYESLERSWQPERRIAGVLLQTSVKRLTLFSFFPRKLRCKSQGRFWQRRNTSASRRRIEDDLYSILRSCFGSNPARLLIRRKIGISLLERVCCHSNSEV